MSSTSVLGVTLKKKLLQDCTAHRHEYLETVFERFNNSGYDSMRVFYVAENDSSLAFSNM